MKSEEAKKKEKAFFEKNKSNEGVIETESGLQYKVVTEGTGAAPAVKDTVEVKYVGKLVDGKVFDESKGETVKFTLAGAVAYANEAVWASSFSDEIGCIDANCLEDYVKLCSEYQFKYLFSKLSSAHAI